MVGFLKEQFSVIAALVIKKVLMKCVFKLILMQATYETLHQPLYKIILLKISLNIFDGICSGGFHTENAQYYNSSI